MHRSVSATLLEGPMVVCVNGTVGTVYPCLFRWSSWIRAQLHYTYLGYLLPIRLYVCVGGAAGDVYSCTIPRVLPIRLYVCAGGAAGEGGAEVC